MHFRIHNNKEGEEGVTDYCVTGVNRTNTNDDRVSELKVWEHAFDESSKKWVWKPLGKKPADFVAGLLANKNKVFSGKEVKQDGKVVSLSKGYEIEFVLRISENDERYKISDMPSF